MKYTIKAINSGPREWQSKMGGTNLSWKVDLVGEDGKLEGDVEIAQKKETPAITVGQELEGTIDHSGKYGPKFKKDYGGRPGGGGGGGRPRDPQERASIERQVAFKGAVELCVAMNEKLDFDTTKTALTDFFNHGLALIQGDPVEKVKQVFPGTTEEKKQYKTMGPGKAISPRQGAIEHMRGLYKAWAENEPNAAEIWANKLASLGLQLPDEADDQQIEELISFLESK
jgi:hypothetical protein